MADADEDAVELRLGEYAPVAVMTEDVQLARLVSELSLFRYVEQLVLIPEGMSEAWTESQLSCSNKG